MHGRAVVDIDVVGERGNGDLAAILAGRDAVVGEIRGVVDARDVDRDRGDGCVSNLVEIL